jgi:Arc/MetJ-type ribon-helix-helix transcriptional regulator
MKRTQIYLEQEQQEFLENLAFVIGKQKHKKVSVSEVIRSAINLLREKYDEEELENETELILKSDHLMTGIKNAKNEKDFLSHEEVFGKK